MLPWPPWTSSHAHASEGSIWGGSVVSPPIQASWSKAALPFPRQLPRNSFRGANRKLSSVSPGLPRWPLVAFITGLTGLELPLYLHPLWAAGSDPGSQDTGVSVSLLMPGFSVCGPQGTGIAGKGRGRTTSPGPASSAFTHSEARGRGSGPRGGMRAPKALHRQLPLFRRVFTS